MRQCTILRIPKSEWNYYFLNGLHEDLKQYVFLKQPKTFEEVFEEFFWSFSYDD